MIQANWHPPTCVTAGVDMGIPAPWITVPTSLIARGLVQTTLRRDAGKPWRRLFAGISHRVINLAFDSSDLRLSPGYSTTFRDFSGTTRIGELGQALAWSVFSHWTRFRLIVDFAEALATFGIPPVVGGPDFLAFDRESAEFVLLECKGTASAKGGPSLTKGLGQCTEARAHLVASGCGWIPTRCIATSTRFSEVRGAVMSFRDPAQDGRLPAEHYRRLRRMAYAPWFEAAGNRNAERLRTGAPVEIQDTDTVRFIYIGETDEMECFIESSVLTYIGEERRAKPPSRKNVHGSISEPIPESEVRRLKDPEITSFGDGTAARLKPAVVNWLEERENRG